MVGNSGTIVIFQTTSLDDKQYIGHLFEPYIDTREIQNLPAYNFYARLSAIKSQEPVSGQTIVPSQKSDQEVAKRVIESSRTLYARPYVAKTAQKPARAAENKKMITNPPSQVNTRREAAVSHDDA
jgi:hypothetical protein